MKKIVFTGFLFTVLILSSCSGFLDKTPYEDPSAEALKDAASAIALINGAYQPMQRPKIYNMRIWTLDIIAGNSETGGQGSGGDGDETIALANFTATSDNAGAKDVWRGPNPGILYCNTVLENVPNMNIDQKLKDRCIGEAKFLRASYYFILVRLFGDVPLMTSTPKPGEDIFPSRTDKMTIYNEVIIPDLKDAINLLPPREDYTNSADKGRASKGAAAGTLAKVYLTLGDFQDCLNMCYKVDSLGYTLNLDYSDCFGGEPKNKNTPESLFEIQYSGVVLDGVSFWDDANQSCWLSTYMGPRNAGFVGGKDPSGYGWNLPTQEFVDQYEPGDLRKDKTILYEGCPDFYGNKYEKNMSRTGYNVRKFLVPISISPEYNTNPANIVALRYADVLLMEAEALNELGRTSEAVAPLYKVRARAGLTNRSDIATLNQAQMREKIIHERRMELAFEGDRWFDLIRLNNGQYALDFLHSIGRANANHNRLLYPIPQSDIDANPNLKQNPGY